MRRKANYLSIIVLVLFISTSFVCFPINESPEFELDPCQIENQSFTSGESLVYKIFYNLGFIWLPAGEVSFDLSEEQEVYKVKVLGRTYKNYEKIYKVHDYYYSEFYKSSLLPRVFVRNVNEGKYRRYDSILFDQKGLLAKSFWGKTRETASWYEFDLKVCAQDMLSNLYYVRNIPFEEMKKGNQFPVHIFFDRQEYPLNVLFKGVEKNKKIKDLGVFNTIWIEPDVVAGHVFKDGTKMKIWISNDQNKIPLLIESPVTVGSVKAVLISHEGLKYPLAKKN